MATEFPGFDGWLRVDDDNGPSSEKPYSVSEFIAHCNMTLEREFDDILIEGEVASFKVNQGKWIFFDLKEDDSSVNCFMVKARLHFPLEDGMKIRVRAVPKLTRWGKFSLTVAQAMPVGEGNIKKSFELLKKKLTAEGLFAAERKRPLPEHIHKIGVISSTGAAGYIDFLQILDNRWAGLEIYTANTQVQGMAAPGQIIEALDFFNQRGGVDVIAILRGGGSADDLAAFNDEALVRAIAASRLPVITGIGHEIDESLADLAADVRASTPSNAAERLSPDRHAISAQISARLRDAKHYILEVISAALRENRDKLASARTELLHRLDQSLQHLAKSREVLRALSPERVLERGYAIVTGKLSPGNVVSCGRSLSEDELAQSSEATPRSKNFSKGEILLITTYKQLLTAEIQDVKDRN